jgi:hypothetical protein
MFDNHWYSTKRCSCCDVPLSYVKGWILIYYNDFSLVMAHKPGQTFFLSPEMCMKCYVVIVPMTELVKGHYQTKIIIIYEYSPFYIGKWYITTRTSLCWVSMVVKHCSLYSHKTRNTTSLCLKDIYLSYSFKTIENN